MRWKLYSSGYASGARGLWKREPVLWGEGHNVHFLGTWTFLGSLGMDPLSQPWGRQSDLAWWAGPPCGLQLSPHPTTERLTPTTGNIYVIHLFLSSWDQLCKYLCWSCAFHPQGLWPLA